MTKKTVTMNDYEGWLMRYADGALDTAQTAEVERFLDAHPDLRRELDEVAAVRVTPVVANMPRKERLLRREPVVVWRRVAASVALLVVGAGALLLLERGPEAPQLAQVQPVPQPVVAPESVPSQPAAEQPTAVVPRPAVPATMPVAEAEPQEEAPMEVPMVQPLPAEPLLADAADESMPPVEAQPTPAPTRPSTTRTVGYVLHDAQLSTNAFRDAVAMK